MKNIINFQGVDLKQNPFLPQAFISKKVTTKKIIKNILTILEISNDSKYVEAIKLIYYPEMKKLLCRCLFESITMEYTYIYDRDKNKIVFDDVYISNSRNHF